MVLLRELIGKYSTVIFLSDVNVSKEILKSYHIKLIIILIIALYIDNMKKYRIVEQSFLGGNKTYIPQSKEIGFLNAWCNFRKSFTEVKVFSTFKEAEDFVESIRDDESINRRITNL
jgi:hypothetical protein